MEGGHDSVRPALLFGANTLVLKRAQKKKLESSEMRMLHIRWMCGVTKLDKIRNERIRGTTKVGEIAKKVQGMRFDVVWACDEKREHCVGGRAMEMKVQGRRKGVRFRRKWLDRARNDIKEKGLSGRKWLTVLNKMKKKRKKAKWHCYTLAIQLHVWLYMNAKYRCMRLPACSHCCECPVNQSSTVASL